MMEGQIKIGTAPFTDLASLGMYIADSDAIFSPPQTDMEEQYFPELGFSVIHTTTANKPFDYKVKFGIIGDKVGGKIYDFFLSTKGKSITLRNYYTKIQIGGYIKSVGAADKYAPSIATFDVVIRVNNPAICNFKL